MRPDLHRVGARAGTAHGVKTSLRNAKSTRMRRRSNFSIWETKFRIEERYAQLIENKTEKIILL